jgi:DNA-binding XRE family transcriptional regulator
MAREHASLTREELAAAVRRPVSVIDALEAGRVRPSVTLLGALSAALSCRCKAFYSGAGEPDYLGVASGLPSELGAPVDAWIGEQLARAPGMTEEQGRRTGALLFPA